MFSNLQLCSGLRYFIEILQVNAEHYIGVLFMKI